MANPPKIVRPTNSLNDVLSGNVPLDQAHPSIQSWASFFIYQGACECLEGCENNPAEIKRRIDNAPKHVKMHIAQEARRIWKWRKENG